MSRNNQSEPFFETAEDKENLDALVADYNESTAYLENLKKQRENLKKKMKALDKEIFLQEVLVDAIDDDIQEYYRN